MRYIYNNNVYFGSLIGSIMTTWRNVSTDRTFGYVSNKKISHILFNLSLTSEDQTILSGMKHLFVDIVIYIEFRFFS